MSLQKYLLAEFTRNARLRSPAELVREVDQRLRLEGHDGWATASSADMLQRDREAR